MIRKIKARVLKAPTLVNVAIFLCLGMGLGAFIPGAFFILYILCGFSFLLSLIFRNDKFLFNFTFSLFVLFLGATILKNSLLLPANHISKMHVDQDKVTLYGLVVSDPVYQPRKTYFILEAQEIELGSIKRPTCGEVMVNDFAKRKFSYAERLVLEGNLYKPIDFSSGVKSPRFSYKEYLKRQGIYNIFSLKKENKILSLGQANLNPLKKFAFKIKDKLHRVIFANLAEIQANLLAAILLGERQNMPAYINNFFIQTGTAHILAISGLHVGIDEFIILVFLKAMNVPRKIRFLLVIIFLVIYCLLTGARASVIRATVMAIIVLSGYLLQRESNIYNSLSLAAIVILLINPWQLFEVGFQLSFLSVIFIVALAPRLERFLLQGMSIKSNLLKFFIKSFSVSSAAWLGTAIPIAYYFGIISPVTVLANLVIVPYMSLVLASGISLGIAGIGAPILAPIIGSATNMILIFLILIAKLFSSIPFAYFYLP